MRLDGKNGLYQLWLDLRRGLLFLFFFLLCIAGSAGLFWLLGQIIP